MMLKGIAKMFNLQDASNPQGTTTTGASDAWTPPASYPWDWWQKDMKAEDVVSNTTVEACVSTISQSVSMLDIKHYRKNKLGGKTLLADSKVAKVLKRPNPFQTKNEFFVDIVRKLLLTGNGYAIAIRDEGYNIEAIYPALRLSPVITSDHKEVFYSGSDTELHNFEAMIPARNVLHLKMHTNRHPLIGETPLTAAALSGATGTSIQGHTNRFFKNMARPSGVLSTDMTLSSDQTKRLRAVFNELSQDLNTGGLPILTSGLKYQPVSMTAVDSEIIKTYKMTKEDIASVFRVPLALIGDMEKASFANVESLMKFFVASGLGYIIENIEESIERLFDLPIDESIEFDTDFLLQADFKSRLEGYKVGVTGGFITPNEVRRKEGLLDLDGGDDLYMQMQNTPIDLNAQKLQAEIDSLNKPDPEPAPQPQPVVDEAEKAFIVEKRLELKDIK